MSVLPFQPTPFFANKNRAFWNLQILGWGGAFSLRASAAIANGEPADLLLVILTTTATGFLISLALSVIYKQFISKQSIFTWSITMLVLVLAIGFYASIEAVVEGIYRPNTAENTFAQRLIGLIYIPATLLGGWTALYFAINYFLTVEKQAVKLDRLEAQATSAQLAMLRYQLNPHFLFNTLNSISTLVLLKQTEAANAMLERLSAFLRHTLLLEPGGMVTLAQEIESSKLYLEIERMRFEERLRTKFAIEEQAKHALLPPMLLQPLFENAIKYAVSPQEKGARIDLIARLENNWLEIIVEDTGPGLEGPRQGDLLSLTVPENRHTSTGLGLTNIRKRLRQTYGENHLFSVSSPTKGGFKVSLRIPYETGENAPLEIIRKEAETSEQTAL